MEKPSSHSDYINKPGKAASSNDVGLGASSKDVGLGTSSKQGERWEAPLSSYYPKDPSKEREWDTPENEAFHTFCQEVTENLTRNKVMMMNWQSGEYENRYCFQEWEQKQVSL